MNWLLCVCGQGCTKGAYCCGEASTNELSGHAHSFCENNACVGVCLCVRIPWAGVRRVRGTPTKKKKKKKNPANGLTRFMQNLRRGTKSDGVRTIEWGLLKLMQYLKWSNLWVRIRFFKYKGATFRIVNQNMQSREPRHLTCTLLSSFLSRCLSSLF